MKILKTISALFFGAMPSCHGKYFPTHYSWRNKLILWKAQEHKIIRGALESTLVPKSITSIGLFTAVLVSRAPLPNPARVQKHKPKAQIYIAVLSPAHFRLAAL